MKAPRQLGDFAVTRKAGQRPGSYQGELPWGLGDHGSPRGRVLCPEPDDAQPCPPSQTLQEREQGSASPPRRCRRKQTIFLVTQVKDGLFGKCCSNRIT